ncbi:MAG: hypothetical protein U9R48_10815, partial [Chloroflexota bacterium]|nr:hypothetical protein [Chloroflexota bacterium]
MPSVFAELDLGLPVGNAYGPMALAVDDDTAYVLCRHYRTLDAATACVAVIDLKLGTVEGIWPLCGTPVGLLAAGGERVYLVCEREDEVYLLVLDAADGRKVYDIDLRSLGYVDGMWIDSQRGRLYLSLPDRLQVRDAQGLDIIDDLAYPFKAVERHVAFTEDMGVLLVSLSNVVYAYELPDMTPLWDVETPLETVQALVVGGSGAFLMAQGPLAQGGVAGQVLFYSLEQGHLSDALTLAGEHEGKLVWGDASLDRLAFARTAYPPAQAPILHLWSTDLEGEDGCQERRFGSGVLAWGLGPNLYVLDRQGHRMISVDGATLETEKPIQLGVELHGLVMGPDRERMYVNDT